jgi:hypothetical protein
MNIKFTAAMLAAGLISMANTPVLAGAEEDMKAMEAAAERVKKGADDFRAELQRIREERKQAAAERKRLQAQQEAERRREADEAREQARRDAAALASAKQDKERIALAAAQERSRREAAARAEAAEKVRQAALAAQKEREEKIARAQAALAAMKADTGPAGYEAAAPQSQAATPRVVANKVVEEKELTPQQRAIQAMQQMRDDRGPRGME